MGGLRVRIEREDVVFDTLSWPSSIISNGPPPIRGYVPSLSTSSREGWRDATEESHGGAVRGDPTRIRVRGGYDSRGGPQVRRASSPGARGVRQRRAQGTVGTTAPPPAPGAGRPLHRGDLGRRPPGASQATPYRPSHL